jgi:PAT family beta-lactamase induction signal transducer AmpG
VSLAERPRLRLFLFSAMFFAQGIGWAFMAIQVPAIISAKGMTLASTGTVLAVTVLPYAFKWVWGPIMDAFTIERFGRRRPWLVFAQAMMALSAAALLFVDDYAKSFDLLVGLMLVHTIFNAMQNVAVDALALDLLPEAERGRANGIMYGSKYAGGIAGGLGMATIIEYAGQRTAIIAMVVVLAAITLVPLLLEERSGPPPPRRELGEILGSLGRALGLRSVQLAALVMLLQNIAGGLMAAVSPLLFIQKLGWSDTDYGQIAGGPSLVAGFVGSLFAGFAADKVGHRRLACIAIASLGAIWLGFALAEPLWTNRTFATALFLLEPFAQSVMVVSLWALCMDTTSKKTATTQFALYTSLMNASTLIATKLIAPQVGSVDYQTLYFAAAGAQVVVFALVPLIDPREARRVLSAE